MNTRKKSLAGISSFAIGAGLVYVGLSDYYALADSAVTGLRWYLAFILMAAGAFLLLAGTIALVFVFASGRIDNKD